MMQHWLAGKADQVRQQWVKRFDPRFWTVDFPRPMMAAVMTAGSDGLVVEAEFLRRADLAGLIWEAEDRWSHPLLALATARDFRGTRLAFRWRQTGGALPLDAVNGPVLTIEGRDAAGSPRSWYVRLWNYAEGSGTDADIALDFDALDAGFNLADGAERVWAGDIDRMFISLVAEGFDGTDAPLQAPVAARLELSEIQAEGPGSMLRVGDAFVPPHGLRMCSGYDDSYNQTPERLIEAMLALGYRETLVHYVGMSHFPGLRWDAAAEAYLAQADEPLCGPARAWHADFLARAVALGFSTILSLSFELLDQNCPADWAQRNAGGGRGLTGYTPPSALLSPAHPVAMAWLQAVAAEFVALPVAAGDRPRFQIGEPWWWVGPDHAPCLYDAATLALHEGETGLVAPRIDDVRAVSLAEERDWLDWCGALLGRATLALRDAVRGTAADAEVSLLFYAPQVLDAAAPELVRANVPLRWAWPAFDVLQLEDYEFVTRQDAAGQRRARAVVSERLGYPLAAQHYFAGFATRDADWPPILNAADAAMARGVAEAFVWAWPQVARDGFVAFASGKEDDAMPAFHDVLFPLHLGYGALGGPNFSTQVVVTGSGHEQRNSGWADARQSYDAALGVRSEADLALLLGFFRARRGQAHGFRFNDPLDNGSAVHGAPIMPFDQPQGIGDGVQTRFRLVKTYGDEPEAQVRQISRPVVESVVVAVDGAPVLQGWSVSADGWLDFDVAPVAGAEVRAGYLFDVPVRFAADRIDVSIAGWQAGELPSVPLVEIRED